MNPKVSVIIPTYKRSDFLERAIDSVLNQTYSDIEIIVIDDNDPISSHRSETEKKMNKYIGNYQIKYVKNKKNIGGALARNEGVSHSTGDFITFLDDDDIYLPKKIETQVNYMLKSDTDLTFTDVRIHNKDDILIDYREHKYIKDFSNTELLKQHILHHLTPTATYMFKRESFIKIGGFDDVQMGQEFMLMLKAIEKGLKINYIPVAHIIQYIHDRERISVGRNKIIKEKEMYNFKKKYFNKLSFRERQYLKFRHHAVLTVVGIRSNKLMIALINLFLMVLSSPIDCLLELSNHKKKIKRYQNIHIRK